MTLLISLFAAVICTALWYKNAPQSKMKLDILCWIFWGASIMWFVDAIAEYIQEGAEFFNTPIKDMVNDTYLGLAVVAFGLVIWIVMLLSSDPKGVIRDILTKQINKN